MYSDLIIILSISLVLIILSVLVYKYFSGKTAPIIKKRNVIIVNNPDSRLMKVASMPQINHHSTVDEDILTEYDRQVTFDPMIEPTRRPPRHQILPI